MRPAKLGENIAREWREDVRSAELWQALQLVKRDPMAGAEALTDLAEAGSSLAMMYLGSFYRRGKHGIVRDAQLAEHWLARSAAKGSVEGAYGLAYHWLDTGRVNRAVEEYFRLGELGYSPAFYALGAHFYKGDVVERDLDKALTYFNRGEALRHLYAAIWAARVRICQERGLWARLRAAAKWTALLPALMRMTVSYPHSDRLRVG